MAFQRNWCPVSGLHPHTESSANQMEPLDLEVALSEMKPTVALPAFLFDCLLFNINPVLLFFPLVTLLLWGETWKSFRRSSEEWMSYLLAGLPWACANSVTLFPTHEDDHLEWFSLFTVEQSLGRPLISTGSCCAKVRRAIIIVLSHV